MAGAPLPRFAAGTLPNPNNRWLLGGNEALKGFHQVILKPG